MGLVRRGWRMRLLALIGVLALSACGGGGPRGAYGSLSAGAVECAPYARQVTGMRLYGAAASWWDQADGMYPRSARPVAGGVLVFQRSSRLPYGHVSVVTRVVSDRAILVTQANWVHHHIARSEPVVDVSDANDWTLVRVWWAPGNVLGSGRYPAYGFLSPRAMPGGGGAPGRIAGLQAPPALAMCSATGMPPVEGADHG